MPRAIAALLVTAIATALLFSFHPSQGKVTLAPPVAGEPPARSRPGSDSRTRPTASHRRHAAQRTIVGSAVPDPYGTVQVAVTLRGTSIVDVRPVQLPLDSARSQAVNSQAAPLLRSEALRAQSAQIDVVSGATYTSEAYARSLQAALARAHA